MAGAADGGVQVDEAPGVAAAGQAPGVQTQGAGIPGAGVPGAEELDALRAQLQERTGDLQRVSAEYANYRRRVDRDRQVVTALAKAQVAGALLTVLDDIERAEVHGDLSGAFKVVADKLVAGLVAQGLEAFGNVGDGFDPGVHEAVQHSTSPDVSGPTVTVVLRRGYRFGERVLRPAMVVVTDAEPATAAADPSADPEASRDAARWPDAGIPPSGDPDFGSPSGGAGSDPPPGDVGPARED